MPSVTFGPFRLSRREQCLFKHDKPLVVGSRALHLLEALIARKGELVPKEVLIAEVWPDVSVGDANLSVQLAVLRRILGQDETGLDYIRTERGRGYRFVGVIETEAPADRDVPLPASHNLPNFLTRLIGRDRDIEALSTLLATQRLVTITGLGGVGKTRLGVEIANRTLDRFPAGTVMIELAVETVPAAVPTRLSTALGVDLGTESTSERLIDGLRVGRRLILIDNCEHLVAAVAEIVALLLRHCPELVVLATSREPLAIPGEAVLSLSPLDLPPIEGAPDRATILAAPAVALLLERTRVIAAASLPSDDEVAAMAEICRRLDGIPLAIELAAARLPALGAVELARRLGRRFAVLTRAPRTVEPRQKTLQAMMDWSHELLTPDERIVLRRLGIFVGGWTLEAAEAVVCDRAVLPPRLLDLLSGLVDKSLVTARRSSTGIRYGMLETVREYAVQKLQEAGEVQPLAQAHGRYFHRIFAEVFSRRPVPIDDRWLRGHDREIDNVRRVLDWAFGADGDPAIGIGLLGCTRYLWYWVNRRAEGAVRCIEATHFLDAATSMEDRARLLVVATRLLPQSQGDRAKPLIDEAIRIYRTLGQSSWLGDALIAQACIQIPRSEFADAMAGLDEVCRLLGDDDLFLRGCERMVRAFIPLIQGDVVAARSLVEQCCVLFRQGGCISLEAQSQMNLADMLQQEGRLDEAIISARIAVGLYRDIGDRGGIGLALHNLTGCLAEQGSWQEARTTGLEAMTAQRYTQSAHWTLDYLALVDLFDGAPERAARLAGYVDLVYGRHGLARQPVEQNAHARLRAGLEQALAPDALQTLEAEGAGWTEAEMMTAIMASLSA